MKIDTLEINNIAGIKHLAIRFSESMNIICGPNGLPALNLFLTVYTRCEKIPFAFLGGMGTLGNNQDFASPLLII